MKVVKDYPGGNIHIISAAGDRVVLEQEIRDSGEWWFYWNFCVEGAEGREIVFRFSNGEVVGRWGPAVSRDGIEWSWAGSRSLLDRNSFRYSFGPYETKVFFCFSLPYQVSTYERFIRGFERHPGLVRETLTRSERGRDIPLVLIGSEAADFHVFLTCRHHACESTASYLLEGLMRFLLEEGEPELLRQFRFHILPFVDIDGVENGDQGKARRPHDHNNDYVDKPLYRFTQAFIPYVEKWKPVVGFDFHSPWKWGGRNDVPFLCKMGGRSDREIDRFSRILQKTVENDPAPDKIIYRAENNIEAGQEWNIVSDHCCDAFFLRSGARMGCTLEFPYSGEGEVPYTRLNMREFGHSFGRALETYLLAKETAG